jgi:hypothetical protein
MGQAADQTRDSLNAHAVYFKDSQLQLKIEHRNETMVDERVAVFDGPPCAFDEVWVMEAVKNIPDDWDATRLGEAQAGAAIPSTLDPRPSTRNPRPSTLNPRPSTLDPNSCQTLTVPGARNPGSEECARDTQTLNPRISNTVRDRCEERVSRVGAGQASEEESGESQVATDAGEGE